MEVEVGRVGEAGGTRRVGAGVGLLGGGGAGREEGERLGEGGGHFFAERRGIGVLGFD